MGGCCSDEKKKREQERKREREERASSRRRSRQSPSQKRSTKSSRRSRSSHKGGGKKTNKKNTTLPGKAKKTASRNKSPTKSPTTIDSSSSSGSASSEGPDTSNIPEQELIVIQTSGMVQQKKPASPGSIAMAINSSEIGSGIENNKPPPPQKLPTAMTGKEAHVKGTAPVLSHNQVPLIFPGESKNDDSLVMMPLKSNEKLTRMKSGTKKTAAAPVLPQPVEKSARENKHLAGLKSDGGEGRSLSLQTAEKSASEPTTATQSLSPASTEAQQIQTFLPPPPQPAVIATAPDSTIIMAINSSEIGSDFEDSATKATNEQQPSGKNPTTASTLPTPPAVDKPATQQPALKAQPTEKSDSDTTESDSRNETVSGGSSDSGPTKPAKRPLPKEIRAAFGVSGGSKPLLPEQSSTSRWTHRKPADSPLLLESGSAPEEGKPKEDDKSTSTSRSLPAASSSQNQTEHSSTRPTSDHKTVQVVRKMITVMSSAPPIEKSDSYRTDQNAPAAQALSFAKPAQADEEEKSQSVSDNAVQFEMTEQSKSDSKSESSKCEGSADHPEPMADKVSKLAALRSDIPEAKTSKSRKKNADHKSEKQPTTTIATANLEGETKTKNKSKAKSRKKPVSKRSSRHKGSTKKRHSASNSKPDEVDESPDDDEKPRSASKRKHSSKSKSRKKKKKKRKHSASSKGKSEQQTEADQDE